MKILLFSAVCKNLEIFEPVLKSWFQLNISGFELEYLFFDDNKDIRTSEFLNQVVNERKNVSYLNFQPGSETKYTNHDWDSKKIDRIIAIKNAAIDYTLAKSYDYLFLVDADLVLHQDTLINLLEAKKDFIFNIFWTKFREDAPYTPNAWDFHSWGYHSQESYYRLKQPGIHLVGGGGACTLLSNEILAKGLTFDRLLSMHYQGEDRHFCTRAQALGYDVYVDSRLPSYHIFHEYMAEEATIWYNCGAKPEFFNNWLDEKWHDQLKELFNPQDTFTKKVKKFLFDVWKSYQKYF